MHLIIDNYGIDLSINNNRLTIQKGEVIKYLVPSKITAIHVITPCTLTTPVVTWAAVYGIALLLYNSKGKVAARLWQPHFGSHAAIRIQQIQFCRSAEGLLWVKQLLQRKAAAQLHTQITLPKHLQHKQVIEKMNTLINRLNRDAGINIIWLRVMEAAISRWYWAGIALALKQHITVMPRNYRPAKDRFNAILNYLYGTLYGMVEGSLLAAGIDPHISIMHRMEYNTPALVFDVIEPFRHWADDFLIQLVLTDALPKGFTEEKEGGILLTPAGKKSILTQWFAYLHEKTPVPKKMVKRKDQVQQLASALAAMLLEEYKQQNKKSEV